jgi:hypothetical protein
MEILLNILILFDWIDDMPMNVRRPPNTHPKNLGRFGRIWESSFGMTQGFGERLKKT